MGNLKKAENPLVAQFLANEFLERNYKNFLEIYTDGSVLDDGAAGAAFVVPEFNNMTHSFSLPAVSVYTAELMAILMALQHMSAIRTPPSAIVVCSDSKAALSSSGPTLPTHGRIWWARSWPRHTSWSPAVRRYASSGCQHTSVSPATRRLTGQRREGPRKPSPWQSTSTSAWPIFIPG